MTVIRRSLVMRGLSVEEGEMRLRRAIEEFRDDDLRRLRTQCLADDAPFDLDVDEIDAGLVRVERSWQALLDKFVAAYRARQGRPPAEPVGGR
jgi:hypothetical protein